MHTNIYLHIWICITKLYYKEHKAIAVILDTSFLANGSSSSFMSSRKKSDWNDESFEANIVQDKKKC